MIVRLALALIRLPDGRFVFERRKPGGRYAGGQLGLFGGHIEQGEEPELALRRELGEEISLSTDNIPLNYLGKFDIPASAIEGDEVLACDIFSLDTPHDNFRALEGDGVETLALNEALLSPDLALALKYLLPILKEKI